MLELAQFLTISWIVPCFLEKDTGRALSNHTKFNSVLGVVMVWTWLIYLILK